MGETESDRPRLGVERGGAPSGPPPWRLHVDKPQLPAAPLPGYPRGVHRLSNPDGRGDVLIAVTSEGKRIRTVRLPPGVDRERVALAVRRLADLLESWDPIDLDPRRA